MKGFIKKIFLTIGGAEILRIRNRTPRILFWHGVDDIKDHKIEAESFDRKNFIQQINYLKSRYEIISIDEFYERYNMNRFNGNEVVLTFDDGYKNNLTVVAPILKKYSIPFTVFISTNNISTGNLYPTTIVRLIILGSKLASVYLPCIKFQAELNSNYQRTVIASKISEIIKTVPNKKVNEICLELISNISKQDYSDLLMEYKSVLPLSWDEVRALEEYGCTIGSHCMDHICCHNLQDKEEVMKQISQSKIVIEEELSKPCHYFAYPNGDYTAFSDNCVKTTGYRLGFSTKRKYIKPDSQNTSSLPRIGVPLNIDTFKIFINQYPKS